MFSTQGKKKEKTPLNTIFPYPLIIWISSWNLEIKEYAKRNLFETNNFQERYNESVTALELSW